MDQITTAIYENGILRPTMSLDLPEHSEVEITIHTSEEPLRAKVRKALGLPEVVYIAPEISPKRRAELAELFSGDPPVSGYILEDRDSRDDSI